MDVTVGIREVENGYVFKVTDHFGDEDSLKEWTANDVNGVLKLIRARLEGQ